ncbi:hypothetical protein BC831DRAFT_440438 [Entophlyctis helioformis]|nr:hypothetical protein BC831DRAFT_440438 [Entophlyctis helioformis]
MPPPMALGLGAAALGVFAVIGIAIVVGATLSHAANQHSYDAWAADADAYANDRRRRRSHEQHTASSGIHQSDYMSDVELDEWMARQRQQQQQQQDVPSSASASASGLSTALEHSASLADGPSDGQGLRRRNVHAAGTDTRTGTGTDIGTSGALASPALAPPLPPKVPPTSAASAAATFGAFTAGCATTSHSSRDTCRIPQQQTPAPSTAVPAAAAAAEAFVGATAVAATADADAFPAADVANTATIHASIMDTADTAMCAPSLMAPLSPSPAPSAHSALPADNVVPARPASASASAASASASIAEWIDEERRELQRRTELLDAFERNQRELDEAERALQSASMRRREVAVRQRALQAALGEISAPSPSLSAASAAGQTPHAQQDRQSEKSHTGGSIVSGIRSMSMADVVSITSDAIGALDALSPAAQPARDSGSALVASTVSVPATVVPPVLVLRPSSHLHEATVATASVPDPAALTVSGILKDLSVGDSISNKEASVDANTIKLDSSRTESDTSPPSVPVVPFHMTDSFVESSTHSHSSSSRGDVDTTTDSRSSDQLHDSERSLVPVSLTRPQSPSGSLRSIDGWSELSYGGV